MSILLYISQYFNCTGSQKEKNDLLEKIEKCAGTMNQNKLSSALHFSTILNVYEPCKILIDHKADPSYKNNAGFSSIDIVKNNIIKAARCNENMRESMMIANMFGDYLQLVN